MKIKKVIKKNDYSAYGYFVYTTVYTVHLFIYTQLCEEIHRRIYKPV